MPGSFTVDAPRFLCGWHRLAAAVEWRPVYGVPKLFPGVTLPPCRWARGGEVIRVGVVGVSPDQ